jgi:hypothetical protein
MNINEQKKLFAREFLKSNEAFKAARVVCRDDMPRALDMASSWPSDPVVREYMDAIVSDEGEMKFLPQKSDAAGLAWELANNPRSETETRIKALKLYAEICSFIEKPQTNLQVNNMTNNQVMLVADHGTDQQWEQKLAEQQRQLVTDASVQRH